MRGLGRFLDVRPLSAVALAALSLLLPRLIWACGDEPVPRSGEWRPFFLLLFMNACVVMIAALALTLFARARLRLGRMVALLGGTASLMVAVAATGMDVAFVDGFGPWVGLGVGLGAMTLFGALFAWLARSAGRGWIGTACAFVVGAGFVVASELVALHMHG